MVCQKNEEIARRIKGSFVFVLVAWLENNQNDRCITRISRYRSPTDVFAEDDLIGFGMPFSSGDPFPAASIY